ncbi:MAG: type II secretion system GspH family protein [Candidatus Omnitrophica bacterium]|jgi:prepilin-type N-terminal cleavage/methylation domain-containing protein|nr:type II secretion system GspH family protein [Candidatus Omnitrophota bacterium]
MISRPVREPGLSGLGIKGFTLVEIIVSLILVGIGLFLCTKIFIVSKYLNKEAENKARAMELVSALINERLAQSYLSLSGDAVDSYDGGFFNCTTTINEKQMPAGSSGKDDIPYKEIEVICGYQDKNANGQSTPRSVRLVNIVPYPRMHFFSAEDSPGVLVRQFANSTVANKDLNARILEFNFDIAVKSDYSVFYNIATEFGDISAVADTDLIYSACLLINKNTKKEHWADLQTGTPIRTQPTINSAVTIENIPKGSYIFRLIWWKQFDRGEIRAKRVNMVIEQVESE